MNVLYGGLVTWLVTLILVESFIAEPIRSLAQRCHPKLGYLCRCHLCSGVWIGWAVALVIPGPFTFLLSGLLYKAVGHLTLEVVGRLKK